MRPVILFEVELSVLYRGTFPSMRSMEALRSVVNRLLDPSYMGMFSSFADLRFRFSLECASLSVVSSGFVLGSHTPWDDQLCADYS